VNELIGILLPTRGRYVPLRVCLNSLAVVNNASDLEVVVVCDGDETSFNLANDFNGKSFFGEYKVIFIQNRVYSVGAFNKALKNCSSEIFLWTADKITYDKSSIFNIYKKFIRTFPDKIGVLAIGGKLIKANFGISSKKFVEYNGDWFWNGYVMNYCDDELTCRAVLLGRYSHMKDSGLHIEESVVKKFLLYENMEEKIRMKKIDRRKFYKRVKRNFDLNPEKIYGWGGRKKINLQLKGE